MSARYITTTLPYVNSDPHIGFAQEIVQADALARVWRSLGDEVFFNTGTDEHGQKIYEAAQKSGQEVQSYVDHYASEYKKLKDSLGLSYNAFIRTTDEHHILAAQEMWKKCDAKGDIYKKTYTGLYCVGCELYKNEKDLSEEGFCLIHTNKKAEEISEENYFFKFSNYEPALLAYLQNPSTIIPEWRQEEAINFVKNGLEDFSISRERERLSLGVPVPGDDTQVMYVWFDALTNYISTLGWPHDTEGVFKKFWEEGITLQVAGKDQIRFQSLMWQAMLLSADIKNTDQVFYHGFITSEGQKMSKSLGNVINPLDLVEKYGTDATRYMLLRHVHPFDDSDVTWSRLDEWYTANLTNGLGNLVARVMKLAETYLTNPVLLSVKTPLPQEYRDAVSAFEFNQVIDMVWNRIQQLDERITREEPFKLVKEDLEKGRKLIEEMVLELYEISQLLLAFLPHTSATIEKAVRENKKPENLFPRL
jgi:methionyl-tRNA synthetase